MRWTFINLIIIFIIIFKILFLKIKFTLCFKYMFFGHTLTKFPFKTKLNIYLTLVVEILKGMERDPDLKAGSHTRHNQGSEYQFRYH